jgi:hypothetical protein
MAGGFNRAGTPAGEDGGSIRQGCRAGKARGSTPSLAKRTPPGCGGCAVIPSPYPVRYRQRFPCMGMVASLSPEGFASRAGGILPPAILRAGILPIDQAILARSVQARLKPPAVLRWITCHHYGCLPLACVWRRATRAAAQFGQHVVLVIFLGGVGEIPLRGDHA